MEGTLNMDYERAFDKGATLCKITQCTSKYAWYKQMVGNPILLRVVKGYEQAQLVSMPDLAIRVEDFVVL